MVDKCGTEHLFEIIYFFDHIGDESLVLCFQHDHQLTRFGFAMNFGAGKLFNQFFYGRQVFWPGMYYQARNGNFLLIHASTLPDNLTIS